MFFFGLLSTNIPYIILMGLYFLGFGLYSSNAIKEKLLSKQTEKVIELKKHENSKIKGADTFHFYQKFNNSKVYFSASIFKIQSKSLIHLKIIDSHKEKYIFYFYKVLFSRPPPVF